MINYFDKLFYKVCKSRLISNASLFIENSSASFSYEISKGDFNIDSPIILASITKMFTSSCIFKLCDEGKISLNDKVVTYFNGELDKLHVYKNIDYTKELTIYSLLYQTSGLPDIFDAGCLRKEMLKKDFDIDFKETISYARSMKKRFSPLDNKKAYYADVNFDILGEIIERVCQKPLKQVFDEYIIKPLNLVNTYLPTEENNIPSIRYKKFDFDRPKSVICSKASGGCVSTTRELMIFTKAFFNGKLFDLINLNENQIYRPLQVTMMPMQYGKGHMCLPLHGYLTAFQNIGSLYGHLGSSGSFAFYCPELDMYYVGTLNQMCLRRKPVQLLLKLAMITKKLNSK